MPRFESDMMEKFEKKAEKDGSYAIAYALLVLAREHREFQENMTFGKDWLGSNRYPGVGEKIGMEMADLNTQLGDIAQALRSE